MTQDIFGKAYKTKNGYLFYPFEVSIRHNETEFYGMTFHGSEGVIPQSLYESELTRSEENDMVKVKQHTPAPWHVNRHTTPKGKLFITVRGEPVNGLSREIAEVNPNVNPYKEGYDAMDNARLIASAPELLEALELIYSGEVMLNSGQHSLADIIQKHYQIAKKAINKAKGL